MGEIFSIAIDGPAGAGKSTIARQVADKLGCIYVDTGAMYRAMALFLLRKGLQAEEADRDPEGFQKKVEALCPEARVSIDWDEAEGVQHVRLMDEDVSSLIRNEEVSQMASKSSAIGKLRKRLVELQQELASRKSVVMDGRDIGTVVLPDATVKVYLTASVEERARRRFIDSKNSGENEPYESIVEKIRKRDHQDMTREVSPLRQAEDAVLVDSSDMTVDQVVETIINLLLVKKNRPAVITAKTAGFCFGVRKAVNAVYEQVARRQPGERIVTFGPIIHNETVVEDLKSKGVDVVGSAEELEALSPEEAGRTIVVIRSHGVTKEQYERLVKTGVRIIDTTCTFVKRIHDIVVEESRAGKHVVIIGNHGHAEVEGTYGWAEGPVTVIETEEEARNFSVKAGSELCVVGQTTFDAKRFEELVDILQNKRYNIAVNNTICNATQERQSEAREIAAKADVMIVVGGKGSSNTARLYEICRAACERTYFLQTVDDMGFSLNGTERLIGITAGASTPKNIIEEVQSNVRRTDF